MLKFSMILQAVDRASAPARRIEASMKRLGAAAKRYARDLGDPARAEARGAAVGNRLRAGLDRLAGGFAAAGRAARRWAGRAGLGSWGEAAETAGRGVGSLLKKGASLAAGAAKWAAVAAGGAASFAVFDLFSTAAQFEQYKVMLENMEGSAAAAQRSFDWVKSFAATTPYELADVMEAFVALKAYGIDPMNGSLMALGDAASGMSKPISQAVEALADAVTGEYERLKEFGIRAAKQGDKVTFTYRKAGKDITRTVKATGAEIESALTGIFTDRFGGMMQKQSLTFIGMISNIKDAWSNFLVMVADAGIFDRVKEKLQAILIWVNDLTKSGKLKVWAEDISAALEKAFNWATSFTQADFEKVASDLGTIARVAGDLAGFLKHCYDWARLLNEVFGFGEQPLQRAMRLQPGQSSLPLPSDKALRGNAFLPNVREGAFGTGSVKAMMGGTHAGIPLSTMKSDLKVGGKAIVELRVPQQAQASLISPWAKSDIPLQLNLGKTMLGPA